MGKVIFIDLIISKTVKKTAKKQSGEKLKIMKTPLWICIHFP